MTDVIIFIDALSPRELSGVFEEQYQSDLDSGFPRVTPKVMSEVYTGRKVSENGMLAVSKYNEEASRPEPHTIIDQAVREGMSVLCMGMPYCIPFKESNSESLLQGTSAQEQEVNPEGGSIHVLTPPPQKDMIKDDPEEMFGSARDNTIRMVSSLKESMRNVSPDIVFFGYRLIDSYCHFQHTEGNDDKTYREMLIDVISDCIREIYNLIDGEVLWFSDHGQTELTEVFRVNRWLREEGYLEYSVDENFLDTMQEHQMAEQHPVDMRVENQVILGQPGVSMDESKSDIVCADPYDSCMTLLTDRDSLDIEKIRNNLLDTGMYRSVKFKWEVYDEGDTFYDTVPDIIPDRKEGVFVSGNIHPNPVGMGWYRTGVHDRIGCVGGSININLPNNPVRTIDMYNVIKDFIGLDITTSPVGKKDIQAMSEEERSILQTDIKEVM